MIYPIARITLVPFYKLWLRKVEGLENVPKDKPFIIAANHSSYYDALLIHVILVPKINKKIRALVNNNYWKFFITKIILDWGECIPVFVGKESKEKNKQAFRKAIQCIKEGGIIEIFPEGGRSADGRLQKAYNGVAKIALAAKAPVLPVGIIDAHKVLPKGAMLPRLKRCEVKIGKLMHFDDCYNKKINDKLLEDITRSIMNEIAKLITQEYNY
ncbi:1-acyl-sn-glycerol-3-phosphate acyltransferase [Candidatus Woesearchaeota archaeon]|nr:1-acyl-sn-glycerol-3-phosphate acyltransferase [Candidatus Woesearchaeota archaeon]